MQSKERLTEGWYLIKARPRQEQRAWDNLEAQGFDVYCPFVKARTKGLLKEEALFPGYLFLYLDLKDLDRYHKIRSTRGVNEIIYFNRITRQLYQDGRLSKNQEQNLLPTLLPKPIPNGQEIIKDIRLIVETLNNNAEGKSKCSHKAVHFNKGDKVIMNHPLFRELEMTFMTGLGSQRGLILVQYIKKQRSTEGQTVSEAISQKEMKVSLVDLEKA